MIEKSNSTSLALATIAILRQPPSYAPGLLLSMFHAKYKTWHCLYGMTRRAYCPLYHFQAGREE
ncbi:hypothetical protein [Nitrosomonas sp. ANs5]|uniref:hypothetical protein n=1 Tax=Nitrosomonas sp. ANs5 TaxID=3423941 RepID=UPI003D331B84